MASNEVAAFAEAVLAKEALASSALPQPTIPPIEVLPTTTIGDVVHQLPLALQWRLLLQILNRLPSTAVDHVASATTSQDWLVLRRGFTHPSVDLTRRVVTYALTMQNQTVGVTECHPFVVLFVDVLETMACDMALVLAMVLRATQRPFMFVASDLLAEYLVPGWLLEAVGAPDASHEARQARLLRGLCASAICRAPRDSPDTQLDAAGDCHPWGKASSGYVRKNAVVYLAELASRGYPHAALALRTAATLLPGTLLLEGLQHAVRSTQHRVVNANRRFTDYDAATLALPALLLEEQPPGAEPEAPPRTVGCSSAPSDERATGSAVSSGSEELGLAAVASGAGGEAPLPFHEATRLGSWCLFDCFRILAARFPRVGDVDGGSGGGGVAPRVAPLWDLSSGGLYIGPYFLFLCLSKRGVPRFLAWRIATEYYPQILDLDAGVPRGRVMLSLFVSKFTAEVLGRQHAVATHAADFLLASPGQGLS